MKIQKNFKNLNAGLAHIFHRMSDIYKYNGPLERFRAVAYDRAAKTIENMQESIMDYSNDINRLDELSGIGKSIASKIQEYCQNGKIREYETMRRKVPEDLIEMMEIDGIGPSTIRQIHDTFHVNTRNELKKKLSGSFSLPKGLGRKKMEIIFSALKKGNSNKTKYAYAVILPVAQKILKYIQQIPHADEVYLAGSLRRKKEMIGDIDLIIVVKDLYRDIVINRLLMYSEIKTIISRGNKKISIEIGLNRIQCDIRLVEKDALGSALLYFTGSKEHNIQLRSLAKTKKLKINEYGVFNEEGKKIAGKTETEIYRLLGLAFIPPEMRVGENEIKESLFDVGKSDLDW